LAIEETYQIPPFSLDKAEKERLLTARLLELTKRHITNCPEYAAMMRGVSFDVDNCDNYYRIPFLPVSLFKELDLKSIPQEDVFKVITSSGTTGQAVSKIFLDKATAGAQQKVLVKIVSEFTGSERMPMLIIDSPSVIKNRDTFSARGAGILGFSIFGSDRVYALNDDMEIDIPAMEAFLEKHKGKKLLLFGFTFMVWLHFYKELLKLDKKPDLQNGVLIHGGGWKKLTAEAVSKDEFKQRLAEVCGISDIHDYYGMVEQTGCVYMECDYGHLHASVFSDIITRRHIDFSPCAFGEPGIVQVVSVLPESYPGHSLLTEDEGVIVGEDDCPCGRKGKYFHINGRLKMAEIRGCSDTYAVGR
jgi:phenylacetate-coenzyme A ligase PaaK-like adenylate-forming protein